VTQKSDKNDGKVNKLRKCAERRAAKEAFFGAMHSTQQTTYI
jgi:hypothetical protein